MMQGNLFNSGDPVRITDGSEFNRFNNEDERFERIIPKDYHEDLRRANDSRLNQGRDS